MLHCSDLKGFISTSSSIGAYCVVADTLFTVWTLLTDEVTFNLKEITVLRDYTVHNESPAG